MRAAAAPLLGGKDDYDRLLELVGDARFVLIGEASHGTHEFYRERARITRRLIEERGFTAVAVEADWPDAYRVNRYVRGTSDDPDAMAALGDFQRFPRWMWRNADVLEFVEWLRDYNDALPSDAPRVGFYGLDLYSLHTSIQAVLGYLDKVDPEGAVRARARYACFDHFGDDPQVYGYADGARPRRTVRERGRRAIGRAAAARRRARPARWARGRGRALLCDAERASGEERGGVLPGHVPRPYSVLESPRPAHGRNAGSAGVRISKPAMAGPRSSSGRTTRISAMPARRRWWPRAS